MKLIVMNVHLTWPLEYSYVIHVHLSYGNATIHMIELHKAPTVTHSAKELPSIEKMLRFSAPIDLKDSRMLAGKRYSGYLKLNYGGIKTYTLLYIYITILYYIILHYSIV